MKRLIELFIIAGLVTSCAKVEDLTAPTKDLNYKVVSSLETTQTFVEAPDSIAIYFIPRAEDLRWESELYSLEASDEEKLYVISREVAYNGLQVDNAVSGQFLTSKKIVEAEAAIESAIEDTDHFDCDEAIEYEEDDMFLIETCKTLLTTVSNLESTQLALNNDFTSYVGKIQMALDGRKDNNTTNWIYVDKDTSILSFSDNNTKVEKLVLTASFVTGKKRTYDSNKGDIEDLNIKKNLGGDLVQLNFTLKEKTISTVNPGEDEFTGYIYKATLNRSFMENGQIMRFLGKIKMYHESRPESVIREGKMKFLLLAEDEAEF